jgi:Sec-independent protein translocase protein TatA
MTALGVYDWIFLLGIAVVEVFAEEIRKLFEACVSTILKFQKL